MNFKVGEKVVCINASGLNGNKYAHPKEGNTYIIDGFMYCPYCGIRSVMLQGFNALAGTKWTCCNGGMSKGNRQVFNESRFTRPISNSYKLEVSIPELITITETQLQ